MPCLKKSKPFPQRNRERSAGDAEAPDIAFGICGFAKGIATLDRSGDSITLDHHVFSGGSWKKHSFHGHPKLQLAMTSNKDDYIALGRSHRPISPGHLEVITDTGAQLCLWSRKDC